MSYDDERDTDPWMPAYSPFTSPNDAPYAHALLALHERAKRGEPVHIPGEIADWYFDSHQIFSQSELWKSQKIRRFVADYSSEEEGKL